MNAGMFGQDQSPVGLYVEDRRKLHEADTRGGATNFHMKPNGVFWIGDKVAGVTETSRYLASSAARALRDAVRADADHRRARFIRRSGRTEPRKRSATAWARAREARSPSPSPRTP